MAISMRFPVCLAGALTALCVSSTAFAAASILVWPIDPVIEHDEAGTAIWLENNGPSASRIQIRALRWNQVKGLDELVPQENIVVSPPAAEILPGQRQLLRLIRTVTVQDGRQEAYRILIDEIPGQAGPSTAAGSDERPPASEQVAGLAFQLRYSVPLFVSGKGAWTREDTRKHPDSKAAAQPLLTYTVQAKQGQHWLVLRNTGPVHARLSHVSFLVGGREVWTVPGLLGYVLPGAEMRFEVPGAVQAGGTLKAIVNADRAPRTISTR